MQGQYELLQSQIVNAVPRYNAMEADLLAARTLCEELRAQVSTLIAEKDDLEQRLANRDAIHEGATENLIYERDLEEQEYEKRIRGLQTKCAELQKTIDELTEKLEQARENFQGALEDQGVHDTAAIAEREAEIKRLRAQLQNDGTSHMFEQPSQPPSQSQSSASQIPRSFNSSLPRGATTSAVPTPRTIKKKTPIDAAFRPAYTRNPATALQISASQRGQKNAEAKAKADKEEAEAKIKAEKEKALKDKKIHKGIISKLQASKEQLAQKKGDENQDVDETEAKPKGKRVASENLEAEAEAKKAMGRDDKLKCDFQEDVEEEQHE